MFYLVIETDFIVDDIINASCSHPTKFIKSLDKNISILNFHTKYHKVTEGLKVRDLIELKEYLEEKKELWQEAIEDQD